MSDGNLPPRPPGGSSSGLPKSIGAPVWSITRRERKEVTPPTGRSREGSEEATDSVYQSRTMTSTERVQIVQMPLELSEASVEQLRMLTLSPRTEASREVCTTSTTIEAGSVPLIGGVTNNGVHLINGVYLHGESRQTTTIITTTTTSYKILEDEPSALSLEMPLRISSRTDDEFVMVKEGTESSITSTSEDEGPVSSLTSADEIEEETKTMHSGIAKTSIVVIPSRVSRGSIELIPQDKDEQPKWEKLIVGKLNATKLERELEEEPLQNWIILSDGRREVSTQTAKPKKKTAITWSPQMEIASTSKVGEHKSIPIDDYVQIYSNGCANDDENFEKETLTKAKPKQKLNMERIWKEEGFENYPPKSEPFLGPVAQTYRLPELEAVPVMDKIERIHKGFYEEGQMPTVVHEERELTPSEEEKRPGTLEAEKRPGTLERITHLFTKRTATGEEWPTMTEPYTGTLVETNRRAELAESSFGEHVSAYASGRSDEIGQQAVTTIVREHYPAAVAYEGPLSETAQNLELEGAPLNSHVTVYHHGRSDLEETPLAAPEPITEKVTTKISSLFKRKTHHEDFPVSEPFTGPLSETTRVPELRREPIDAMVNVYSTGRYDEFAAAEPITIAKVEPEPIVEYPRMAAYEGPLQSTSKGVELEGQPLEAHVSAYHHGRSDVVPAAMETITSKLTSIFKKTTTHGEDYPPKSEPFLGPVAQTYRLPELEAVPVMDKIERIHKGFYEEGQMPTTVVQEERELTPSEAEKRPGTLERITHLFTKRTATGEEWPTMTEPYTGTLAETNRRAELAESSFGEHVSAYASGRSDEIGQQAVTTIVREHYPAAVAYEGPLSETAQNLELEGAPLNSHVTVYHHGRSDLEETPLAAPEPITEKVTTKISSLFKRKTHHEDFPVSEPFTGPLSETTRVPELRREPIDAMVNVYSTGRYDEFAAAEPITIAKVEPEPIVEYPRMAAYEGPLQSTSKGVELEGQPLEAHVSAYHHGRSDVVPAAMETITSKLTSIFKKTTTHGEDYPPKSEPFLGPVAQTYRLPELEAVPVMDKIERIHKGFYEEGQMPTTVVQEERELTPSEAEKRPGTLERITHLFTKRTATGEEWPTMTEPYTGTLAETNRRAELAESSFGEHVSAYASGRSDEIGQQAVTTIVREHYPAAVAYEGPLSETAQNLELEGAPLNSHVTVYHHGRSDLEETPLAAPEPITEKVTTKISSLFKRKTHHEDFPVSEPFTGPLSETTRVPELRREPIDAMVNVYSTGRYDEFAAAEPITIAKVEPEPIVEYPRMAAYEGPLQSTSKGVELEGQPLEAHVSAYHHGRSDVVPAAMETITSKLTSIFKKTTTHGEDYPPKSEPFLGPVAQTYRLPELEAVPVMDKIERIHKGFYEEGQMPTTVVQEERELTPSEAEKRPGTLERITHLFTKRTATGEEWPTMTEPYTGTLAETNRRAELAESSFGEHVSAYASGRSDEIGQQAVTTIVREHYPAAVAYEGPLSETAQNLELEGAPLNSHVTVYHHGRSDLEETPLAAPEPITEKVTTKISSLFKRKTHHEDFPVSEPFTGPLSETTRVPELRREPIDAMVNVYSTGRYDEFAAAEPITIAKVEPEPYPRMAAYEGPLQSTSKGVELEGQPLEAHVSAYHHGRSDVVPAAMETITSKLTSIFKKTTTHGEDYPPKSEPFLRPVAQTYRLPELEAVPVMDKIERIHKGFYEEGQMPTTVVHEERELTPSEAEKRPGTLERITHLFTKRTATGEEWPTMTEPYTGTLAETNRRAELAESSFGEHVSAYASGRLDEIGQQAVTTIVRERYPAAVAYEGPLSETAQNLELEGAPLNSHVTVYHHGRSDLEETPLAAPEPITEKVTTKISSLFKRKTHHEDFPVSEPFTGPLSETTRVPELRREPIDAMVNVYSTGRYDEFAAAEPINIAKVEPESMVEYPRMAAYEGPLQSTSKGVELEGQPLEAHVSAYHHGRSDVVPAAMETITSKLTSIFKKTTTHGEDYPPKSEPFLGPVAQTYRLPELEAVPVMDKIERIHKGFYEESQIPTTVVHEERELTPSEAEKRPGTLERITHLFTKRTATGEEWPTMTEPYTGTLAETNRRAELAESSFGEHVSAYASGRSDEIGQQAVTTIVREHYPAAVAYEGPLSETAQNLELEGAPLNSHVTVYHHGRSDLEETPLAAPEPITEKVTTKISSLFKRKTHHEDFPVSEPFTGPLSETTRVPELRREPIDAMVNVYSTGRYDEFAAAEPITIAKVEPEPIVEYPRMAAYEGPLQSTSKGVELEGQPLEAHVSAYHHGRSDVVPAAMETITSKLTSIFKKTTTHGEDYPPKSEPFLGPVAQTYRLPELEAVPVMDKIERIHKGSYYQLFSASTRKGQIPTTVVHEERELTPSEAEKRPGTLERITHLFTKRTATGEEWPTMTEPYTGTLAETNRRAELAESSFGEHVSAYASGRSDEIGQQAVTTIVREHYPAAVAYEGPLSETAQNLELEGAPLNSHVTVYHHGRSDLEETPLAAPEPITEKVTTKISSLFKRKTHHEDFPVSEPFTGPLSETTRVPELRREPIDAMVNVYSTGRYDEFAAAEPITIAKVEPEPIVEYPRMAAYEGPLQSTSKGVELEGQPLEAHVSAYHHGRSDVVPAAMETITSKLTSIFKKTTTHGEDYPPKSEPFLGPVAQTYRLPELEAVPVMDKIERIHKGFYEEGQIPTTVVHEERELTPSEAEKRPGTLERITHLFTKRTATGEEWPTMTEPYTGTLAETNRRAELAESSFGEHVSAYASGRSDEIGQQAVTTIVREHYPAAVAYEGPLSETAQNLELEGAPLNSHVTVYHHGRSDLEETPLAAPEPITEKVTTKISSLFKRKTHHEDFPVSEPFTGPLSETTRVPELRREPIDAMVNVYSTGRYDEFAAAEPITIAKVEPEPIVEYPRMAAYEGPLQSTSKGVELEGQPLEAHVSAYHHGRSDVVPAAMETITSKLTSIFKKTTTHGEDYPPKSEPFLGPVAQTYRLPELEAVPVMDKIERIHKGFYEEGQIPTTVVHEERELTPSEAEKRPGTLERITHLFTKRTATGEEWPTMTEPYTGTLAETNRRAELAESSFGEHVSAYASGRSDEIGQQAVTTIVREHYPAAVAYEGPLSETAQNLELEGAPLNSHVTVYHHGRSDLEETPLAAPEPITEKVTTKISSLFKRKTHHEDFPVSEPFTGPLSETTRVPELRREPIDAMVNVYSTGRYDEFAAAEPITIAKVEPEPIVEYPRMAAYEGPLQSTSKGVELEGQPLEAHVSAYHHGRSDVVPAAMETITSKLTSIFKKTTTHGEDYPPKSEPFLGPVAQTYRLPELEAVPVMDKIERIHKGFYEEGQMPTTVVHEERELTPSEAEKRPGTLERITHLFTKRTATGEEWPTMTEPYTGTLAETNRRAELAESSFGEHVSAYASGRSDEIGQQAVTTIVREHYPAAVAYEGPLSETAQNLELEGAPLNSHVTVYHHGRSDLEETPLAAPEPITEKVTTKISSLFKRKTHHEDFPVSEPFTGPLSETTRVPELRREPIDAMVNVYSTGRYDEFAAAEPITIAKVEPEPIVEYPRMAAYEGPLQSTSKGVELEGQPLEAHVSAYHHGRSDVVPAAMETITSKLTSIFKKTTTHGEDYPPKSEPFLGPVAQTYRLPELEAVPVMDKIERIHKGFYEEGQMPTTVVHEERELTPSEAEKRPGTLERITHLFTKRTATGEEWPTMTEPYTGTLAETNRRAELAESSFGEHVSAYASGRSDEIGQQAVTTIVREHYPAAVAYEGPLSETAQNLELEGAPLNSHVTVYHHGRSDLEETPLAAPEPITEKVTTKISSLFKRKTHHEDFPVSEPFTGPLSETTRVPELRREPIDAMVNVYSTGRYDEFAAAEPITIAKVEPEPIVEYPRMAAYEGPLQSTSKGVELEGQPLEAHVSAYHHGRSDVVPAAMETITSKLTSIFKKTTTHGEDYPPKSEPFLGPVAQTYRLPELEAVPVMDKIERIHKGFYEEGQMPTTVVHEERELTPSEAEKRPGTLERITHLFTKRTATGEEWPTMTEPYTGTLAETNRRAELAESSFGEHVSAYASGRSDEIGQQAVTTIVREHYPAAVAYEGPLSETAQNLELEGAPLNSHVTVYHHGRSDLEETPLAAPEPITEKVTTKISSLFKRKTHHEDFPVSEPFTGPLSETTRVPELRREPIDAMVNVYSTGRYDEFAAAEPITIAKVEPEPIVEYPRMAAYEGPLQSTSKGVELEGQPLEAHVSAYHHGRSDVVPAAMETITSKLTSIFKKTTTHGEDYPPKSEPFLGPVAQTYRLPELEAVPVMDKIERIHKGFYEEGQMPTTVVHEERELTPSEAEKRPGTLERITHLFTKRTATGEEWPTMTEPYTGTLAETNRRAELAESSFGEHVSAYASGRSDEIGQQAVTTIVREHYPAAVAYEGPLSETAQNLELEGAPLNSHVTVYHHGRSDLEETPLAAPEPITEKVTTKISSLFKRKTHHEDFPVSEPFTGPLSETTRVPELRREPIDAMVNVYSTGRYDEFAAAEPITIAKVEPEPIVEYPRMAAYEGPLQSTSKGVELEGQPLEAHVSAYHHGRSDVVPAAMETITSKLTSIFKKTTTHGEDYPPKSEPFLGPVAQTYRLPELEAVPVMDKIERIHKGFYEEGQMPTTVVHEERELTPSEAEKRPGTLERITHLFTKRTATGEKWPTMTEPYTGTLAETNRRAELAESSFGEHVSAYASG
uniref:Titin n=1 Tax=Globodera rostochiensis TaxID=31243 RepID=A0A914HYJ6_GLORO